MEKFFIKVELPDGSNILFIKKYLNFPEAIKDATNYTIKRIENLNNISIESLTKLYKSEKKAKEIFSQLFTIDCVKINDIIVGNDSSLTKEDLLFVIQNMGG